MAASPQSPNNIGDNRYYGATNFETGLTAFAGGGQTSATALTAQLSKVATVASGADSVKLPKIGVQTMGEANPGSLGMMMVVRNDGANSMQVFGATPDTINGVATGTGVAVGSGKTAMFFVSDYTQSTNVGTWVRVLSA